MGIHASLRHEPARDVVVLSGRLTGRDTDHCLAHIQELVGFETTDLNLDLSSLDFIDSSGLGFIVQLNNDIASQGKLLTIINTNPDPGHYVKALIDMTGLKKVLRIETPSS